MSLRLALFISILSFSSLGHSAVQIMSFSTETFSRAEGPFFGNVNATVHTVFGGLSGTCKEELKKTRAVCNSCSQETPDPTLACNARKVHNNLRFGISIQSDQRGKVLVTTNLDDNQTKLDFYVNGILNNETIFEANTTLLVEIPWPEICEQVPGIASTDCDTGAPTGDVIIRVGVNHVPSGTTGGTTGGTADNILTSDEYIDLQITMGKLPLGQTSLCRTGDTDQKGACNFIAYPGDEKIFLEEVYANQSFPQIPDSEANAVAIRVFHSTETYPDINTPDYSDIAIKLNSTATTNADGVKLVELNDPIVGGLQNGVTHFFAIGIVDEAVNVGFVTNMENATDDKTDKDWCYNGEEHDWPQNCHRAEPEKVIGLIEDEFDCFITTATYGSPFRPKVEDFRKFRNRYLKTHWLGKKVIQFYYDNSPPIASWIRNNPKVKPFFRSLLYPFWLVAKASITWPLLTITFFVMLFLGSFTLLYRRRLFQ